MTGAVVSTIDPHQPNAMDSLTLVDVLRTLVHSNDGPDTTRRREQLRDLLAEFLPSEIRFLKDHLSHTTFVRDLIPDLPIEIVLLVLRYLELSDLLTARQVSKRWRETWTNISVCNKLMKYYFRSRYENGYQRYTEQQKRAAFLAASEGLNAMQNGNYHTMRILRYDNGSNVSNGTTSRFEPVLDRQYCSGQVAWTINGGIQLTVLSTGTSTFFMTPDRDNVMNWTLSRQVIVAGTGTTLRSAQLHAWYLDHPDEIMTVRLPSLPDHNIAVSDTRVGIVTTGREIFIWNIGGSLIQMKIDDPFPNYKGFRKVSVFFHPDCAKTVFVVFLTCKKVEEDSWVNGTIRWTIQKYFQGVLQKAYRVEYPLEGLDYRGGDEPAESFCLIIRKIDENGNWSLGPVPVDFASHFLDLGCDHHWDRLYRQRGHRNLAHYVVFNVYEERLSTAFYHLPGGNETFEDINFTTPLEDTDKPVWQSFHLWGGQIFLPIVTVQDPRPLSKERRCRLPVTRALLMAVKSCDQISGPPSKVRYIAGYNEKEVWTTDGRFSTRDMGLAYCWAGDPHIAKLPPTAIHLTDEDTIDNLREIQGDGTFVILFGQFDYVVWCYDSKLHMPDPD